MRTFMLLIMVFAMNILSAQERTITGIVVDGSMGDDPLPGATISVVRGPNKKVSHGTVTDYEGKFTLKVDAQDKSFSVRFMGFETKDVNIEPGKNDYKVVLESDAKQIGEVVVTGYQELDRRKLTSAVTTLKISDEKIGAVNNIDQALAGQIAGLSSITSSGAPGAPVKIRIRGTASINGTQEPLWVLDGIPMDGTDIPSMEDLKDIDNIYQTSIAGLNPSDIDNITVLKDAAATAIYGARAANGVIVITTKKGRAGAPVINFSGKMTFMPKTDIDRLNLLNSNEKVDLELGLLASDYTYRQNKGGVAGILNSLGETSAYQAGGWNALSQTAQNQINQLRNTNTDWNDILFRNALTQEYNIGISGGGDKSDYYTSVGYTDEQGNVKGVGNTRYNITLKTNYQVNKLLKVGASVYANERKQNTYLTDSNGFTNPVYYSRLANPYFTPYDENGNYNYDTNVQGKEDSSLNFNIFEERANANTKRRDRSMMAILNAELRLTDYLKITSQFGLQEDSYSLSKYANENTYAMRKEKLFTEYQGADGVKKSFLPDGGMHKTTEYHNRQWTWKAMAEFVKTFNRIHDVNFMLGTEVRHAKSNSIYSVAYGYDSRTLTTQPVIFPSQTWADSYPLHQETESENAYVSWYATGSYSLLNRYTIGGSVRFDGSDVFGVAKKYRYLPLYSVSGLWRAKEENWLKDVKWMDNLCLRASYGLQGNIDKNTSPYLIGTLKKGTILPGISEDIINSETAPNPNLKWEKTENVNAGIDFAVLHNAITLSVDYYYRHSTDLIGLKMLPLESGFSSTTINWASMNNKGDWQDALAEAKVVMEKHGELEDLTDSKVLPNYYKSVESIVALEQVMTSGYVKMGVPSKALVDTYRTGDKRKALYFKAQTASVYSLIKYGDKGNDGYRCSFRSAEAYLIAAEAAAQNAADNAAADDANLVEARTYLKALMAKRYAAAKYNQYAAELDTMQKADLLKAIYNERTCELAFEGHRWFDLRRTTRPQLSKTYGENSYVLEANDSRYTLRFPIEAVEANPNIEKWEGK